MTQSACPYQLRQCVWEITLACCFRCAHCGSGGGKARENELSTAECLDIAGQLAALGCERVNLIGGEVFMRRDWYEVSAAIVDAGMLLCIISNGWTFTPELCRTLRKLEIESVAISLDGPPDLHDRLRQPGSFERAERAVHTLVAAGIPTSIITTLNSASAYRLPQMYELVHDWGIFAWQLQSCSPMGNAAKMDVGWAYDFRLPMDFVASMHGKAPFAIMTADNIGYFRGDEAIMRGGSWQQPRIVPGCAAGLSVVGIDSVGNVKGCESLYDPRFFEGNLRERSLADIWNDPASFAYNRGFTPELLTGACASCEMGSRCAGGCRSYNHFTHGKLYESPACGRRGKPE